MAKIEEKRGKKQKIWMATKKKLKKSKFQKKQQQKIEENSGCRK